MKKFSIFKYSIKNTIVKLFYGNTKNITFNMYVILHNIVIVMEKLILFVHIIYNVKKIAGINEKNNKNKKKEKYRKDYQSN